MQAITRASMSEFKRTGRHAYKKAQQYKHTGSQIGCRQEDKHIGKASTTDEGNRNRVQVWSAREESAGREAKMGSQERN
eukprot:15046400-Alexandrium_andersonii.AAC.1